MVGIHEIPKKRKPVDLANKQLGKMMDLNDRRSEIQYVQIAELFDEAGKTNIARQFYKLAAEALFEERPKSVYQIGQLFAKAYDNSDYGYLATGSKLMDKANTQKFEEKVVGENNRFNSGYTRQEASTLMEHALYAFGHIKEQSKYFGLESAIDECKNYVMEHTDATQEDVDRMSRYFPD